MKANETKSLWIKTLGGQANVINVSQDSRRVFIDLKDINNVDVVSLDTGPWRDKWSLTSHGLAIDVGKSVGDSVGDFVGDSVGDSEEGSDSMGDSVSGFEAQALYAELVEIFGDGSVDGDEAPSVKNAAYYTQQAQEAGDADADTEKNFMYYVNVVGKFSSEIFMPIVPALITGGILSALNILLVNYMGVSPESGLSRLMDIIFTAAFSMLPIYLGYTMASKLKLEPILGALLGAILVNPGVSGVGNLELFGLQVTQVDYSGSIVPVVLGVFLLYFVDSFFERILPEIIKYMMKPFLTMIIVVPVTLLWLGPIGTVVSNYVGGFILWLMDTVGFIALPILSAVYPYMVMLGIDKALYPIGFNALAEIGYDPIIMVMGFVSNLCVGASALAVSRASRQIDTETRGAYLSFGITGMMGITEPAFYGALIGRPKALVGTAIGAFAGGLVAGIFSLVSYVVGGAPGLLTILFFLSPDGSLNNFVVSIAVTIVAVVVAYFATYFIVKREGL